MVSEMKKDSLCTCKHMRSCHGDIVFFNLVGFGLGRCTGRVVVIVSGLPGPGQWRTGLMDARRVRLAMCSNCFRETTSQLVGYRGTTGYVLAVTSVHKCVECWEYRDS
jgi:hypothetical protein